VAPALVLLAAPLPAVALVPDVADRYGAEPGHGGVGGRAGAGRRGHAVGPDVRAQQVGLGVTGYGEVEDEVGAGPDPVIGPQPGDVVGDGDEQGHRVPGPDGPQAVGLGFADHRHQHRQVERAAGCGEVLVVDELHAAQA
jgi:hypothetical protein